MTPLPRPLVQSLEMLAATAEALELRNDWLVFGGAAMALSGLPDWPVPDIDVLHRIYASTLERLLAD